MKFSGTIMISFVAMAVCVVAVSACGTENGPVLDSYRGIVINEVAAHDETVDADSWVEIVNTSASPIDMTGLGIFLYDQYFNGMRLCEFDGVIGSEERLVLSTADEALATGFASDSEFELRIAFSRTGEFLDSFSNADMVSAGKLPPQGSYQRIPDGTGLWERTLVATAGKENIVRTLDNTSHNAIWLWSTYMNEWLENDAEVMKRMKSLGYDHVLLNYAAFNYSNISLAHKFMQAAAETGFVVHAWIQCFYSGKWVSPVIDEENRYDQELFDSIIAEAESYVRDFGVQGIHLDYIRFAGTAPSHNPSAEVTAVGAVTEFCRQIREAMDDLDSGIILSAAMMAEDNAAYYYGQDAAQMGRYIHILMPMVYRYQEGGVEYGIEWCERMVRLFTTVTDAEVWAGTQTYSYSGTSVKGLDADSILEDCMDFTGTDASGIVLFRYGLGTFPDVSGLWN